MLRYHLNETAWFMQESTVVRTPGQERLIGGEKPLPAYMNINVDGSAMGLQETLLKCGVCRGSSGSWVFGFTQQLGTSLAIRVELFAVWKGLQLAWRKVTGRSSSKRIHYWPN
ncbi:hypothetical protein SLE2022_055810 [Rubroshorea leprosula]